MKKLILFFAISLFVMFGVTPFTFVASAQQNKQYYAKVQSDNVYLFSQPIDSEEYKLFKLPTTYFVLLTGDANESFYSCKYSDLPNTVYVKKSSVVAMNGTPVTPYVNFAYFRVFALDGIDLRSSPHKLPLNSLGKISYLEDRLVYYGSIEGDTLVPDKDSTWYYCKFVDENENKYGYIYSTFCDKLSNIPLNMEEFPIVEGQLFPLPVESVPSPSSSLSGTAKTLIIVGVSLPCVVILYLLIKPTLMTDKSGKKVGKKRKSKHGDYFEFDESDLN